MEVWRDVLRRRAVSLLARHVGDGRMSGFGKLGSGREEEKKVWILIFEDGKVVVPWFLWSHYEVLEKYISLVGV